MLVKHAIVLNRSEEPSSDRNVLFRGVADEDGNPGQTKLWLDQETYIEMGGPVVVTLIVEPGDSLNGDAP